MAIDNLAQANAEIEKLWRRLERLERGAPIGFSSVSRGALRIISPEGLIVEGTARISGSLNGDGSLNWSGDITFTGPFTIDGVTTQNGDYTVNGAWHFIGNGDIAGDVNMTGVFDLTGNANLSGTVTVTGPLGIKGDSTLEGNLSVIGAGKILVGSMEISTQAGGYGQLLSPTNIYLNAPFVVASGVFTALGNVNISGALSNAGIALKAGAVNNLHIDSAGRIWKTS